MKWNIYYTIMFIINSCYLPRSMITDSINDRLRPYTMAYTTVFRRNTWLSITIVFLRVVYEGIRSFPIANDLSNRSYFTVNDRCTTKCRVFIKMMININFLVSVDDRILQYTIRRNTVVILSHVLHWITTKYGHGGRIKTYMVVNDREDSTWGVWINFVDLIFVQNKVVT